MASGTGSPHLYDQQQPFIDFRRKSDMLGQPGSEEDPMDPFPTRPRHRRVPPLHSATDQVSKQHGFRSNQTFEPLPPPTGAYPYRLALEEIVPAAQAQRLQSKLVFHAVGDTGGIQNANPQQIVALQMAADFQGSGQTPSFFYHLGDVVYFNGETSQYYQQFYEPYAGYTAPIVAIPGAATTDIGTFTVGGFWGSAEPSPGVTWSWGPGLGWWLLLVGVVLGVGGAVLPYLKSLRAMVPSATVLRSAP